MKRRHLWELEDQHWFPPLLRDAITDFLRTALVVGGKVYRPAIPLLARVLKHSGTDQVIDLCSGGSGPWTHLQADLAEAGSPVELLLTDKYPNAEALAQAVRDTAPGRTSYEPGPVDATNVPDRLPGVRTLFTSFHHFRPDDARGILRDAHAARRGIGVFEFTERTPGAVLRTLVVAPLLVLLTMPKLRPDRRRLVFTYLLPVIPAAVTWDAVVSNLRTYTVADLRAMVLDLDAPDYVWEAGQLPGEGRNPPVTYLLGHPL
ncbi:hypothetical protein ACQPXM_07720 [Kribbella sp. CA-253562]|uniref:hypothetical protein n=1 Tax=Kribbella sp. CA-253562 TaxID=3239942 RepID=UPI003D8A2497